MQDVSTSMHETSSTTEVKIKLPEIPLDMSMMSVCGDSDNKNLEHVEVKQEPIDSDIKSEEFPPGLESKEAHSVSQEDISNNVQFQKVTESGKLHVVEL